MLCFKCDNAKTGPIVNVYFQEDRLRFWKGPLGNGYSTALGGPMPETRKELNRVAQERGVEFVSPKSMPSEWVDAVEYKKHVDSGGKREEDPSSFYNLDGFSSTDTRPQYMKDRAS